MLRFCCGLVWVVPVWQVGGRGGGGEVRWCAVLLDKLAAFVVYL